MVLIQIVGLAPALLLAYDVLADQSPAAGPARILTMVFVALEIGIFGLAWYEYRRGARLAALLVSALPLPIMAYLICRAIFAA
jgi:hypothetical protein